MIVPIRGHGRSPIGAVRLTLHSKATSQFEVQNQRDLQEFADALGCFLTENHLLSDAFHHYFRIWGSETVTDLAREITAAVPVLLGAESCSVFLRDGADRFVLRNSSEAKFQSANVDRLFYRGGDGSKTAYCLETQSSAIYFREEANEWKRLGESGSVTVVEGAKSKGPAWIDEVRRDPRCEVSPSQSRVLIVVPVQDLVQPDKLAGIIRVVSKEPIQGEKLDATSSLRSKLGEVSQFASGLASVIARAVTKQNQRDNRQRLLDELQSVRDDILENRRASAEFFCSAAKILVESFQASAVTIFLRKGEDELYTKGEYSYLAHGLYTQQFHQGFFQGFQSRASERTYKFGESRTGWVAEHRKVLNLRDLNDASELSRVGITPNPQTLCEVTQGKAFLAAPIELNSRGPVDGVIRAVRRSDAFPGPFSVWDAEVLETCGTVLAGILRTFVARAAISYPSAHLRTAKHVAKLLKPLGVECHYLEDRASFSPGKDFTELVKRSSIGIVLAIPNEHGGLGDEVSAELGIIMTTFQSRGDGVPTRYLVLAQDDAKLPAMGPDKNVIRYSSGSGGGINHINDRIVASIREMLPFPQFSRG